MKWINWFFSDNSAAAKLARTVVQGIIGVLVAYCGDIIGLWVADPTVSALITALVMAVLSPIMAAIGGDKEAE